MAVEHGILNTLEIAIEPVWYTAIQPKIGDGATGMVDTEASQ
jgi:hypothetical protein